MPTLPFHFGRCTTIHLFRNVGITGRFLVAKFHADYNEHKLFADFEILAEAIAIASVNFPDFWPFLIQIVSEI